MRRHGRHSCGREGTGGRGPAGRDRQKQRPKRERPGQALVQGCEGRWLRACSELSACPGCTCGEESIQRRDCNLSSDGRHGCRRQSHRPQTAKILQRSVYPVSLHQSRSKTPHVGMNQGRERFAGHPCTMSRPSSPTHQDGVGVNSVGAFALQHQRPYWFRWRCGKGLGACSCQICLL